jgi:hypothetical protein
LKPALNGAIDADKLLDDEWSAWEKSLILNVALEYKEELREKERKKNR